MSSEPANFTFEEAARWRAPLQICSRPAPDAWRTAARDTEGVDALRAMSASRPARLRDRRDPLSRRRIQRQIAQLRKLHGCVGKGAVIQHPDWSGERIGFLPFPSGS
jgi:hypothetical protein